MEKNDFVFGTRAVIEAVKTGKTIEKVLIKKGLNNHLFHELFQLLKEYKVLYQFVPVEKLNRITRKNHQGIVALLSPVEFHNIELLLPNLFETGVDPFILILDQVTDVRNFGAIVRTAECAGVQAIIIPEKGSAHIGGDAVKTSAGAIHHVPICRVENLLDSIHFLKNSGLKIFASSEKSNNLYTSKKYNVPLAIIMGSEEKGISPKILEHADEMIKIPVNGKIESLNVSVSAAIVMYEVVRQRN